MSIVGQNVILKKSLMVGVIVEQEADSEYYMIRAWDTDAKEYIMVKEHFLYMETIENRLFFSKMNQDDKETRDAMFDMMIDMALEKGDKKWFDEILKEKKKRSQPVEDSEAEMRKVKVGRMVVDNNGVNGGIVICKLTQRKNSFLVRSWSNITQCYVDKIRTGSSLVVVQVPDWNKAHNTKDFETTESIREAFIDIAMATEDYEWLKQLHKKETQESDGA